MLSTLGKDEIEVGKSYLIRYKRFPEQPNAKVYEIKGQILWTKALDDGTPEGRLEITTNHRPWGEGGTGTLWLDQIESVTEIPRGPQ